MRVTIAYFLVMSLAGAALAYVETRTTAIGGESPAHYLWLLGAGLLFDIAIRFLSKDKTSPLSVGRRIAGYVIGAFIYVALHDFILPGWTK